ncbi:MAG: DUF6318 family protein [Mycobacteriales bacterium]
MSIFGPDVKLIPPNRQQRWRQGWWWREKRPAIITLVVFAVVVGLAAWVPYYLTGREDDSGRSTIPEQTLQPGERVPTPSAPARPSENPPERPKEISEPTVAGVEATVRYNFEAINYAQRTGDTEPMKRLYDLERCKVCASVLAGIEDLTQNGRYVEGSEQRVSQAVDASVIPNNTGGYIGVIEVTITDEVGRQLEPDGRLVEELEASPSGVSQIQLEFDNGTWQIYDSAPKR